MYRGSLRWNAAQSVGRERERERERRLRKGFRDRTRERSPITDEYGIISDPSMDHHDSDVPSDNGSHFLGDIE